MPHGMCFAWRPDVLLLHVASDAAIAVAYFSIPVLLVAFARQRHDLPFTGIFWMFGTFIVACGSTHVLAIWTIWHPDYWLDGAIKALTALASMGTAVVLIPLLPRLLALRGPRELEALNARLATTIAELELSKAESEATLDRLDEGVVVFDADMHVLHHNAAAERILRADFSPPDAWANIGPFVDAEDVPVATERRPIERLLATSERRFDTIVGLGRPGDDRSWIAASATRVRSSTGEGASRIVLCVRDVTRLKNSEIEQREYAAQLRSLHVIASSAPNHRRDQIEGALRLALAQLDIDWAYYGTIDARTQELVIDCSVGKQGDLVVPAGARFPLERTVIGRAMSTDAVLAVPDLSTEREAFGDRHYDGWGSYIAMPIRVEKRPFGAIGFAGRNARPRGFTDANVEFVHVTSDFISSVVERGLQRERLDSLAFSDPLTGIANRAMLAARLESCVATAARTEAPFATLFIDLDDFKPVNDLHGHAAGDAMLRAVADCLATLVRTGDTVARLGGDEFVIVAQRTPTRRHAAALARRIVDAIGRIDVLGGRSPLISASVGISLYPTDGEDADTLLARADAAMREAKAAGKGRIRFADSMPWPARGALTGS